MNGDISLLQQQFASVNVLLKQYHHRI